MHIRQTIALLMFSTSVYSALPITARAQSSEAVYTFDLPGQDLNASLRAVGSQAGMEILFEPRLVAGKKAPLLHGTYAIREAVERLLQGSGLKAEVDGGAVIIKGRPAAAPVTEGSGSPSDIVVTGSHIVGAQSTAVVTTVTAEDMHNAGQNDLGEMARSLPQNFGGGQNPGIGITQGTANLNTNVNGASTFNLRGVGNAATLTLLNGNRLSYSGISGAVDISTIPIGAVDRVEVVTDGSSAVYGADAVAGVVNIILKPDYQGLSTTARLGGATDGGDFEQQYGLVGGKKWNSGGFIATYDYSRNTGITSGDRRSYTTNSNPSTYIYPDISRHSGLLSIHQALGDDVTFQTDVVYKNGRQDKMAAYLLNQPISYQGFTARTQFTTFGLAPSVDVKLGASWTAKVSAFYGRDTTDAFTRLNYYGGPYSATAVRYAYDTQAGEVGLQGPLLSLPAGDLRLAIGGGARSYKLEANNAGILIDQRLTNYFGYVEANVPIISPAQNIPLVYRAALTAAMRFEGYSGSDQVSTPKISLAYEPVRNLRLSASWGRSFKLPTLYQRYQGYATVLDPVAGYGAAYPSNASLLVALGANVNQRAERSENWDVGAEWKPLSGLTISSDYFHIDYHDRVATPISSIAGILTNPIYASFVTTSPSAALLSQYINGAIGGLQNATTQAYTGTTRELLHALTLKALSQIPGSQDWSVLADLGAGEQLYRVDQNGRVTPLMVNSATVLMGDSDGALALAAMEAPRQVGVLSYSWSPDGQWLWYAIPKKAHQADTPIFDEEVDDLQLRRRRVARGLVEFHLRGVSGHDRIIALRPDSDMVARLYGGQVSWEPSEIRFITQGHDKGPDQVIAWSQPLDGGSLRKLDQAPAHPYGAPSLGPHGGVLAVSGDGADRHLREAGSHGQLHDYGPADFAIGTSRSSRAFLASDGKLSLLGVRSLIDGSHRLLMISRERSSALASEASLTRCDFSDTLIIGLCVEEGVRSMRALRDRDCDR